MKMWSGRVSQPLNANFERWQRSFRFDWRLLPYECVASRAHARALAAAGILSSGELDQIVNALQALEGRVAPGAAPGEPSDAEDVHHFVEQQLVAMIGEGGYKLHTGRSRNEQVATDLRLFTRDAIDELRAQLFALAGALCDRAEQLGETAMPSYTHLQRAEPILAAHWLLAYPQMFLRDAGRLAECRKRVNVLPLGSGAVAGCSFPLDRRAMARELGFDAISANSMDAVSDRDFEIEFLNALALVAVHLSRMAEDFVLYCSVEFGFVLLPDAFATGSSAMPQKKNPDAMELLRGKAGHIAGAASAVLLTVKGLPLTYNRDLQETQEPLFAAADATRDALRIAADFLRAVEFDCDRMHQAAASGFLNATAAANYLVRKGMPFRRAHEVVGRMVRKCLEQGCTLESLSAAERREFSELLGEDFPAALELGCVLAEHNVAGGTAPRQVKAALAEVRASLQQLQEASFAHA
ncbi:MAG TPA: argininosuccinate lyase [Terriglobales bacterium]|nr:argininosuccinate lyase [Terriglobales bacterium]